MVKKLQASSIHRCLNCPGSAHLEVETEKRNIKYNAFQDQADLGKRIHKVGEDCLNGITISKALKKSGFTKDDPDFDRAKYTAQYYRKYVNTILKSCKKKYAHVNVEIEEKYVSTIKRVKNVFKSDYMIISRHRDSLIIDIFDLKTGNYNYMDSATDQLLFSVKLFIHKNFKNFKGNIHINTHIVQPFYRDEDERVVGESYSFKNAKVLNELFLNDIQHIKESENVFNPDDYCAACPSVLICPAAVQLTNMVDMYATVLRDEVNNIPDNVLEQIWLRKKLHDTFMKALDQHLSKQAKIKPFKYIYLKSVNGHRKWKDEIEVKSQLDYLGDDIYEARKLKSPAQMEILAGKENISELYYQPEYYRLSKREDMTDILEGLE